MPGNFHVKCQEVSENFHVGNAVIRSAAKGFTTAGVCGKKADVPRIFVCVRNEEVNRA